MARSSCVLCTGWAAAAVDGVQIKRKILFQQERKKWRVEKRVRVIVRDIYSIRKEGKRKNDIPHICLEMLVLFSLLFYARSRRLGLEIKKKDVQGGWEKYRRPAVSSSWWQMTTFSSSRTCTAAFSYIAPSKISCCSGGFHLVARSAAARRKRRRRDAI
jgi:hypothetical protein